MLHSKMPQTSIKYWLVSPLPETATVNEGERVADIINMVLGHLVFDSHLTMHTTNVYIKGVCTRVNKYKLRNVIR
jgi:hypothetical protein